MAGWLEIITALIGCLPMRNFCPATACAGFVYNAQHELIWTHGVTPGNLLTCTEDSLEDEGYNFNVEEVGQTFLQLAIVTPNETVVANVLRPNVHYMPSISARSFKIKNRQIRVKRTLVLTCGTPRMLEQQIKESLVLKNHPSLVPSEISIGGGSGSGTKP